MFKILFNFLVLTKINTLFFFIFTLLSILKFAIITILIFIFVKYFNKILPKITQFYINLVY